MKLIVAPVLLLFCSVLSAQAPAQQAAPKFDCTKACTFVTDPYPASGPQPINCRLYIAGIFKAAAAPFNTGTGLQCKVITTLTAGQYTATMTAVDGANQETAQSLPFAFESAAPPQIPAPVNLRIQ
jgi:hypothetical protein